MNVFSKWSLVALMLLQEKWCAALGCGRCSLPLPFTFSLRSQAYLFCIALDAVVVVEVFLCAARAGGCPASWPLI